MTEILAPVRRKLSGWQLREKLKQGSMGGNSSRGELNYNEGTASTSSSLKMSSSDGGGGSGDDHRQEPPDLPPAFRTTFSSSFLGAGRRIRRISSVRNPESSNHNKACVDGALRRIASLLPPTSQAMDRGESNHQPIPKMAATAATTTAVAAAGESSSSTKDHNKKDTTTPQPPAPPPTASADATKSNSKTPKSTNKKAKGNKTKDKTTKATTKTKKKSKSLPDETLLRDTLILLKGEDEEAPVVVIPEDKEVNLSERRLSKLKRRERSKTRKNSVLDSLGKFEPTDSFKERSMPKRGNSAALKRNPYATTDGSKGGGSNNDSSFTESDDMSIHSLSMSSLPPPEREERQSHSCSDRLSLSRSTSSFEASLDLSGHRMLPVFEQISTSATGEQWARFKLLGRLGLGDIQLSIEAEALVDRNYGIMLNAVQHIYALRDEHADEDSVESMDAEKMLDIRTGHLLEEIQATIQVPTEGPSRLKRDPDTIEVDPEVKKQLRDYVVVISSMYRDNAFHDFEHASNVLLNVDKLIGMVQPPDDALDYRNLKHGCGVATEPWNHFALVFAAMIHDVDHNGVPNAQLIKERAHVAGAYKNKSVAEQNSIELAWNLLMEPCYKELRESIFHFRSELTNFRSLVVTAVMATDIADKELAALRKGRAADALKAEEDDVSVSQVDMDLVRRKATFVVETLIQVADVSHTMSSFSVFKKWNHRLYKEMYKAYKDGRAEQDPTETWYKGEFGFFDFYIIPLSKKLTACGIYGEDSEQYTRNAILNRRLWEEKGEELVAKYIKERDREEAARAKKEEARKMKKSSHSKEPEQPKTTMKISLRDMAEWASSSSESESGADFAGDEADADSVSISDGSEGKRRRGSTHSGRASSNQNLANMRDYLKAMTVGGKVPSKASLEMKKDRKIIYRVGSALSGASEHADQDDRQAGAKSGLRIRVRSRSPASGQDMSLRSRSSSPASASESSELGASQHSRNFSPGSRSERSEPKSILKSPTSERSQVRSILKNPLDSPGSGSERSGARATTTDSASTEETAAKANGKVKLRGRRPSQSDSPASTQESSQKQTKSKSNGKVVRRGRRPSRSASPNSKGNNSQDMTTSSADNDRKRGKRPSKVKGQSK